MLILASASPRRRELLTQIGVQHTIHPAHIDEIRRPEEDPLAYVRRVAREKAAAIARTHPDVPVLAADTTVALGSQTLNKPSDLADAERMLRVLASRVHQVHTGIALIVGGVARAHVETTTVTFTAIPENELAAYLATGDSLDKAGSYGIQGYAARWISRVEGDFFNVVGLPLAATVQLLRESGVLAS